MNIDKDALRKAAEAATAGPWYVDDIKNEGIYGSGPDARSGFRSQSVCDEKKGYTLFDTLNSDACAVEVDDDGAWDEVGACNADYIAAANPATVIALLDEIAALVADKAALVESLSVADRQAVLLVRDNAVLEDTQRALVLALKGMLTAQPHADDGRTGSHQIVTDADVYACRIARAALQLAGNA